MQQIIEEEEDTFDEEDKYSDQDHAEVDQGGYADDLKQDENEEEKNKISDISGSTSR